MDKFKNKYEILLGFVTLVISLSAFKEELTQITINLGYATITATQYFLYVVYGFSFCLYLYIVENIFRDTKIGLWNGWNFIIKVAFILFVFILLTPILLLLNIGVYKLFTLVSKFPETTKTIISFITSTIATILAAISTSLNIILERKRKAQEEIEAQEIRELDNATKLYNDGYYSQSILESFKVLETHLFREITRRDIRVQKHKFSNLLNIALRERIINENDLPSINDLRGMRNVSAHTDANHTKEHAQFALKFVRDLLIRSTN